ncbi:MAG: flavodoxin family protein [Candidatus Bathyarchaeota archaeon]|nr:MAG: flavodoxin family protein [Candidatus Bathyarchaeota archaeon]
MKVLVINSSPHFDKGTTGGILAPFMEGMESAGVEVEILYASRLDVKPCLGCLKCWDTSPGKCIQDDDMQDLLPKIADADVLVLATPVYVDGMTAPMKAIIDRMVPLIHGTFEIRDDHCRHPIREGVKRGKLVLVSPCGFTEMDNFDPLVAHVKAICKNMSREYAGALLRPYGWYFPVLARRGLPVERVLDACRKAGAQLILDGRFSEDVLREVSADLVPRDEVVEQMRSHYGDR